MPHTDKVQTSGGPLASLSAHFKMDLEGLSRWCKCPLWSKSTINIYCGFLIALPAELVAEILATAILSELPCFRYCMLAACSRVCGRWRALVMKDASLWCTIHVNPGGSRAFGGILRSEEDLGKILSLSRDRALDIFAVFPSSWRQLTGEAWDSGSNNSGHDQWELPNRWERLCRAMLDLLLKERGRWRNAVIQTDYCCERGQFAQPTILCPHKIAAAIREAPMPRLEHLAIYGVDESCSRSGDPEFEGVWSAPLLRYLELEGGLGAVSVPGVEEVLASGNVPSHDILAILKSCRGTLNTLRMHGRFDEIPSVVRLEHVHTLVLQETGGDGTLAPIETPALENLVVGCRRGPFSFARVLQIQAADSVVLVDLVAAWVDTAQLCLVISGLPNLRDLAFKADYRDGRGRCFNELLDVVRRRRGSRNSFRHVVFEIEGTRKDLREDERDGWSRLAVVTSWHKARLPLIEHDFTERLEACFGDCEHDGKGVEVWQV